MRFTHYVQIGLACAAAVSAAIAPFMTGQSLAVDLAVGAGSLAVAKVLSVQSEVAGDKSVKS